MHLHMQISRANFPIPFTKYSNLDIINSIVLFHLNLLLCIGKTFTVQLFAFEIDYPFETIKN